MTKSLKIGRRAFLLGQAAVLGAVGVAHAAPARKANWSNAVKRDLDPLVGQTFKAVKADGTELDLVLKAVERVHSGWARPMTLARSEGVVADFSSSKAELLIAEGDQSLRVSHPALGTEDLYISITPRRRGGHDIEMILG